MVEKLTDKTLDLMTSSASTATFDLSLHVSASSNDFLPLKLVTEEEEKEQRGLTVRTRSMKFCGFEDELHSEPTSPVSINLLNHKVDEISNVNDLAQTTETKSNISNNKKAAKKKNEKKPAARKKPAAKKNKKVIFCFINFN